MARTEAHQFFTMERQQKEASSPWNVLTIVLYVLSTKANASRIDCRRRRRKPHTPIAAFLRGEDSPWTIAIAVCVVRGGMLAMDAALFLPEILVVQDGLGVCVCASVCFCVYCLRACGWKHDGWVRRSSLAMTFASSCCCLLGNAVIQWLLLLLAWLVVLSHYLLIYLF